MGIVRKTCHSLLKYDVHLSAIALILSMLAASIIIILSGYSPIEAYGAMIDGAFVGTTHIATTLGVATPLIFSGLAMVISSKAGVFNIGAEGQIIIGAVVAALLGHYISGLPVVLHILICIVGASVAGGFWAWIAGVLKTRKGINEVIVTIMLNYVAFYFVEYLISHPFKAEGMTTRTETVMDSAVIPSVIAHTRLNYGIILALLAAVLLWIFLNRTLAGYELRSVGLNPHAAEGAGIHANRKIEFAMLLSGMIAGLGGAIEVMGVQGYYITNMTANYGYNGIAVAVMGQYSPIGTIFSALIFGALKAGSSNMNRLTDIPSEFIVILQALIIIFVSTPGLIRTFEKKIKEILHSISKRRG